VLLWAEGLTCSCRLQRGNFAADALHSGVLLRAGPSCGVAALLLALPSDQHHWVSTLSPRKNLFACPPLLTCITHSHMAHELPLLQQWHEHQEDSSSVGLLLPHTALTEV